MKIYFVRHGETDLNAKEFHQSHHTLLSQKGHKQAEIIANRFVSIPIDIIYSSDYKRAHETALTIAKKIGKTVEINKLLREVKYPSNIEGKYHYDTEAMRIKELIKKNKYNPSWHYSDEENISDLIKRGQLIVNFLKTLSYQNILIVSHGTFINMIIACMVFDQKEIIEIFERFNKFIHMDNTGITVCERTNSGLFRLLTYNDYKHLG